MLLLWGPLLWCVCSRQTGGELDGADTRNGVLVPEAALVEGSPHAEGLDHLNRGAQQEGLPTAAPPELGTDGKVLGDESVKDTSQVKNASGSNQRAGCSEVGCETSEKGPADIREARHGSGNSEQAEIRAGKGNAGGSEAGQVHAASLLGVRLLLSGALDDPNKLTMVIVLGVLALIACLACARQYYTSSGGYTSSPDEYRGRHHFND